MAIKKRQTIEEFEETVMNNSSGYLRAQALKELRKYDIEMFNDANKLKILIKMTFKDPEPVVRAEAITTSSFLFKRNILEEILVLKDDKEVIVISALIAALGYIGIWNDEVENFILSCLDVYSEEIRDRAVRAIGTSKTKDHIEILKEIALGDSSELVKSSAIVSLGILKVDDLRKDFESLLELKETSKTIKTAILDYFGQLDTKN